MAKKGYIYILTNYKKTVLYIGITTNLRRRVEEHYSGLVTGFTKKYNVKFLVYYEEFESINHAIQREKALKGKTRKKKEVLINKTNPEWRDLSSDIF